MVKVFPIDDSTNLNPRSLAVNTLRTLQFRYPIYIKLFSVISFINPFLFLTRWIFSLPCGVYVTPWLKWPLWSLWPSWRSHLGNKIYALCLSSDFNLTRHFATSNYEKRLVCDPFFPITILFIFRMILVILGKCLSPSKWHKISRYSVDFLHRELENSLGFHRKSEVTQFI